eukprot:1380287-Rhodomonas_salina.2
MGLADVSIDVCQQTIQSEVDACVCRAGDRHAGNLPPRADLPAEIVCAHGGQIDDRADSAEVHAVRRHDGTLARGVRQLSHHVHPRSVLQRDSGEKSRRVHILSLQQHGNVAAGVLHQRHRKRGRRVPAERKLQGAVGGRTALGLLCKHLPYLPADAKAELGHRDPVCEQPAR